MDKTRPKIILPDFRSRDADGRLGGEIREALKTAEELAARCLQALGDDVSGIYLHGSLAMGGFNPASSDIDLLVVVQASPSVEKLRELTRLTLELHARLQAGRNIEYTVAEEKALQDVVYPTPAVYHYSSLHRLRYEADSSYLCARYEDPDLASQIVVAYERGFTLYGRPLRERMPAVSREVYVRSILHDVADAREAIVRNPMYVVLNLCRVLLFMQQGHVASKKEGGEWGTAALAEQRHIVQAALDVYTGTVAGPMSVPENALIDFAEEMLGRIAAEAQSGQVARF